MLRMIARNETTDQEIHHHVGAGITYENMKDQQCNKFLGFPWL